MAVATIVRIFVPPSPVHCARERELRRGCVGCALVALDMTWELYGPVHLATARGAGHR